MLSRIAENVFWIGRNIERADATARTLDVHLQPSLDERPGDQDATYRFLLLAAGASMPFDRPLTRADVLGRLALDRHDPVSIAASLGSAREQARRAREIVSSELWECLNTSRARMPRKVADDRIHEFFHWARERSATAVGIIESATSRDDVWRFFTLGRSIERAEATARLLTAREAAEPPGESWAMILRSCGAYEPFLRTHGGALNARNATDFLVLDRLFPKSVLFSMMRAEECLRDIEAGGALDPASRILGGVRDGLEQLPRGGIVTDPSGLLERIRRAIASAHEAIRARYFSAEAAGAPAGQ